jgi:hypothetical protein
VKVICCLCLITGTFIVEGIYQKLRFISF